ncbi:transient receptor potential cation channel subfamily V member 6-like [Rana temporaria]|uniref:transient receptor potential cation channel subfamily V member 6-like n=1 Tax=Rana temporaria TaxID=8407 RepID=UPI001AAE04C7|nr:transient receptor potential cation channel subfamily V member 6-like [Rana temporaria]
MSSILQQMEDLSQAVLSGQNKGEQGQEDDKTAEEKPSWIQAQYAKYMPVLKRSKDDTSKSGRSSSETYSGLQAKNEDQNENSVHLPEQVAIKGSNDTVLNYFIKLSKNEDEQINLETIDQLLSKGCDVNEVDKYGQTAMHEVAKSWHIEVAQFLIERQAKVNKADQHGITPLHIAAAVDYPDMVTFLLKRGANVNAETKAKQTPLHYAAKYDAVGSLKILVKNNADPSARDHKQRTPLHLAAGLDRSEAARLLLNLKCDASVQDDTGLSCLTMMVLNMPPVASLALDQFHAKDRPNRKQHFYLNHVEPPISGFKGTQAKSPLEVIVQARQLDIINHPVIQKLIEVKWKFFGRKHIFILLSLNLLFILSWTALGIGSSLPRPEDAPYKFPEDIWRIILSIIALGLMIYQIVEEFKEIYQSRKKLMFWKEWRKNELEKDLKYCHPMWPEEKEYLQRSVEDLEKIHPSYFKDFWNVFDWIVYFLLCAVIATHIADLVVQDNKLLHVSHIRVFSVTIIFLWLRVMKYARAIRLLGPFIVMLGKIVNDVLKFLFLYGEFYIPYACAFWIIFGGLVENMATVPQMLFTVFRITLVDDYAFSDMYGVDPVMAYILCGTFLGISAILCINLLIALLADSFQRVYDNAAANAVMQQATTLLQIEETLNKNNKANLEWYIQTTGAPLSLFYDDDLTINQDDDLKKVTIQIKEELGELMQIVKEKKLKSELAGMQKKKCIHGNTKSGPKPQQTNSLQRLQPQSSESSPLLSTLIASQQEQRDALQQMNQRLKTLERMIRLSLQAKAPPGSSSVLAWEDRSMEYSGSAPVESEGHPGTNYPSRRQNDDDSEPSVIVDIIGQTRDMPL